MPKCPAILSRDHGANVRELETCVQEFTAKASEAEIKTLLSIMRRWPQMRALSSRDPLFASIVAEFRGVLEVENVPG